MGWKGTLRALNAEAKRAQKRQIEYRKHQEILRSHEIVENQDQYIRTITSFHKECSSQIDWEIPANASEPIKPEKKNEHESRAKNIFENYQPNFLIRLFKLANWRKANLYRAIDKGKKLDEKNYGKEMAEYSANYNRWKTEKEFAVKILNKDLGAYEEFIKSQNIFSKIRGINISLKIQFTDGNLDIEIGVEGEKVVPKFSRTILQSGKMSEKEFPKSQFYQIYQDYVCSVALRFANEFTTIFPVDSVMVTIVNDLLDKSTGRLSSQPLLSVYMPKNTLKNLNLVNVDPSDALRNFSHNMNFKNQTGFLPTKKMSFMGKAA